MILKSGKWTITKSISEGRNKKWLKHWGSRLGGSGAEGIACVAYVMALEKLDVKPDIVSGTGVGGVVASMFAAGMSGADMVDFMKEVDFPGSKRPINLNKIKDARLGILDNLGLEEYYKMVVPIKVFDRLYFPLKIVAADYVTGSEIVFTSGDVARAVRAGVSVPGIFSPYEADDVVCIDGSCVNPLPFDVIRGDCDVLAAIDPAVNQALDDKGDYTVFSTMMSAYNAMKKSLTREKLNACKADLCESVTVDTITTFDFWRYEEIIASMNEKAERFALRLKSLLD